MQQAAAANVSRSTPRLKTTNLVKMDGVDDNFFNLLQHFFEPKMPGVKFPADFNDIYIEIHEIRPGDSAVAGTFVGEAEEGEGVSATIFFNLPRGLKIERNPEWQGKIAATYLHEKIVHAHPEMWAFEKGEEPVDSKIQHLVLVQENNFHHQNIKFMLQHMPPATRPAMLQAYYEDVMSIVIEDLSRNNIHGDQFNERRYSAAKTFADEIGAEKGNPASRYWTQSVPDRIQLAPYAKQG